MADRGSLIIRTETRETASIISPEGEVGYHEAPALRLSLRESLDRKPGRMVVNLAGVHYMATPGLATLIEALQNSKKTQVPLVLCGLNERVRAVFEIARLQTVFRIVADVDAALAQ
jgi:anti-sigma B factor antagonist